MADLHERSLPSGTVTFLFTDIEDSTRLAQQFPAELPALLSQHHAILRQSIEANHGTVLRIAGDSFLAAFYTANDALLSALQAQRQLQQVDWHPATPKVRMGIHTGSAHAGGLRLATDGYSGYLTLTRAQRVMSTAYGGQILLSNPSAELLHGELPTDVQLRDLGEHRLKGLVNPEHLWQVVVSDLPSEFPPIQSLNAIPNNLPAQTTALIGREAELSEILSRLNSEKVRLLTLTGPGGIGKTRLGLQAAAELIDGFKDGIYFVDLAPVKDAESVPAAIAQTTGLREINDRPILEALKGHLREKQMLLLLDNFEQVTQAAPKVVELLRDCPRLKILVTSREALHVRGEYVFPIPPLALPEKDLKQSSFEQLTHYEAVRLFIERAQAVKPDFQVTNENAPAVAEICLRLDGLPLAIELAAARIRLIPPQALLERLGSRLSLLRGGARDLPLRQQTLRDAIDWSYDLLDAGEQRLFELLSVFPGGCTFEAAEATAGQIQRLAEMHLEIFEGLASLVDKSLLRQVEQGTGEPRLLMLETIREYAAERLEADPELRAAAYRAHAVYFAGFAQRQWERLTDHGREATLVELVSEIENLRAAWRYWVGERDLDQLGKFLDSLWLLYDARGWYHSTIDLTRDMLDILSSSPSTPESIQQEILLQTSLARALQFIKGYTKEVEQAYTRALELSQEVGEIPELFPVLRGLGSLYGYIGEYEKASQVTQQIMSMAERFNDVNMKVEGRIRMGYILAFTGDIHLGLDHLERALADYDPDRFGTPRFHLGVNSGVVAMNVSALLLWMAGFPERAIERANHAITLARKLNHPYSLAYALFHTALLHLWRREAQLAGEKAQAALDLAEEHDFQVWRAVATCLRGAVLGATGQVEAGLAQVRRGIDLYQGLNTPPVFWPLLIFMHAQVLGLAGRPDQGLAELEKAFDIFGDGSVDLFSPDFNRLKGSLLLALSPENKAEAEGRFQHALAVAQQLHLSMQELRAATSLCQLWQSQGKAGQGRQVLSSAYEKFTEGFNTADLMEAKELLDSLGE